MDKKAATEAFLREKNYATIEGINRTAFEAGWEAALFNLSEAVKGLFADEAVPTTLWPDRMNTEEDVALPWPDGTRVVDNDGDGYVRYKGVWIWDTWRGGGQRKDPQEFDEYVRLVHNGNNDALLGALPADIISIGKEDN